ncbi:MAG: type II toxin-antitoxin system Phd/YefM family antitoxin [Gammaproteobacteria bacterium]
MTSLSRVDGGASDGTGVAVRCQAKGVPNPIVFDEVASRGYYVVMQAVGLKTLKNKLSEYVRLAAGGERVLLTDRVSSTR